MRAITGIFSKQMQDEDLDAALVTPTMTKCMKSLQENRLVFVCVRATAKAAAPACIKQMQAEPDFKELSSHALDGEEVWGTPAIAGHAVYVRSKEALYCFEKAD